MPMMNFTKQGSAQVVQFDKKAGQYIKIKKQTSDGDVFEVALEDMAAVVSAGIGYSPEQRKWEAREELIRLDNEARDRAAMRAKSDRETRDHIEARLDAIEARTDGA